MKDMEQITREDIIESAIDLFGQHGFHNVSMDRLAKHLGYSKSLIYKHFKSKSSIMHAAVRFIYMQMQMEIPTASEIQARLTDETPEEILTSYCYGSDALSIRRYINYRLLYREVFNFKRISAIGYRLWQNSYVVLSAILEHMADLNAIPHQPDRTLAEMWTRVVFGFTLWKTFDPYLYGKEYQEITALFISLALNGNNRIHSETSITHITNIMSDKKPGCFKEEIINAAFQLFSEYGYENTTIKLLAARLNCHPSRIYHYFKDKQYIMQNVVEYIKTNKKDYFYNSFLFQYKDTISIEDMVQVLSNTYVAHDVFAIKQYRIWSNMIYKNRDIRHYCIGCLLDKRIAFKIALNELPVKRKITNEESMRLAFVYIFCQSSINLENALFKREISASEEFRTNFARIMASIILYGVVPRDDNAYILDPVLDAETMCQ